MLEHMLNMSISDVINYFTYITISNEAALFSLFFSLVGSAILAKFTGTIGNLTIPLNFSALFVGAFLANWFLKGYDVPTILYQQELLLFTIVGMTISSFVVLWFASPANTRV